MTLIWSKHKTWIYNSTKRSITLFVCAPVRFPLSLSRCKVEPTAGRAERAVSKPPAMTHIVGARFTLVVHRGWCRSTVRLLASALMLCYVQDMTQLRICVVLLISLVSSISFVYSIQFVGHSSFGSRNQARIHHKHLAMLFFFWRHSRRMYCKSGWTRSDPCIR